MKKKSYNDEKRETEIREGCITGSKEGMLELLNDYGGIIKKAVDSVGINDHSLTNEDVFMAAVENLLKDKKKTFRSFKGKSKLSTYLYTICRRYAIDIINPSKPLDVIDPDTIPDQKSRSEDVNALNKRKKCIGYSGFPLQSQRKYLYPYDVQR